MFPTTATWVELRARFVPPPPAETELPQSLFERLVVGPPSASPTEALVLAARLLGPLTTRSVVDVSRFLRATQVL